MSTVNASTIYGQPENVSSAPDFFIQYLDQASGGTWTFTLIGLSFGIPFLALQGFNPRQAFAAASFNGLVTVLLLSAFGVVGSFMYTLFTVMVALALLVNRGDN